MSEKIPFNAWSRERISQGRKECTSRTRIWTDSRVVYVSPKLPVWFIAKYLYKAEGADSPEEFRRVINKIFRRNVSDWEEFFVHFGNFKETEKG